MGHGRNGSEAKPARVATASVSRRGETGWELESRHDRRDAESAGGTGGEVLGR
jgi:hypothetical protein